MQEIRHISWVILIFLDPPLVILNDVIHKRRTFYPRCRYAEGCMDGAK